MSDCFAVIVIVQIRSDLGGADIVFQIGTAKYGVRDEHGKLSTEKLKAIAEHPAINIPVSVDTSKVKVMTAAVKAGATMVNDVRALQAPGAVEFCAEAGVQVCLMHMQDSPKTMQNKPSYKDVVEEVIGFLLDRVDVCLEKGILPNNIVIDPGFGFGKVLEHNLLLLRSLDVIADQGYPVLIGLSRKSLFGDILDLPVDERLYASLSGATIAIQKGARIVRTHDVRPTRHAVEVTKAFMNVK